ncbi:hypothetical protein AN958_01067 [Leucoagaricus sp. SymC.cos]|nr:hypothetical protein AN958_01067 [Leucoagaricus sp. SymC.cos]
MFWLFRAAGAGKSAVTQTFAEHCQRLNRLGAALFFSTFGNRDRPRAVIPTLS